MYLFSLLGRLSIISSSSKYPPPVLDVDPPIGEYYVALASAAVVPLLPTVAAKKVKRLRF